MPRQRLNTETGQSAILFAVVLIGLVVLVALAIDGGSVLNGRRVTQNAADSGALSGTHYMVSSDAPTEAGMVQTINNIIESNNVPDTNGIPGDEINANVTIYYTDSSGERLTSQPCYIAPCGDIPNPAKGLDVVVSNQVATFFLGVVSQRSLDVGASATAVIRGSSGGDDEIRDNVLYAFGECPEADRPLDMSLYYTDVIGGIRSGSWFENRGSENHYHGQVYYDEDFGYIDTADIPGYYEPDPPGMPQAYSEEFADPFAGMFTVEDFNCTDGSISNGLICHDVAALAPAYDNEVNYRLLTQNGFLDEDNGQLLEGIYYAGEYPIKFGWEPGEGDTVGLNGTVTLVSSSTIKITERDVQLTGYMPEGSDIPGLLMFSSYEAVNPCANFETDPLDVPINTTGNEGTVLPKVYHNDDGNYDSHELGSLQYIGLLYAPGGRIATSGHGATYVGAIVAQSIRINGYFEFENDDEWECDGEEVACRPLYYPRVGSLFVLDANLYPATSVRIFLDE